MTWILDLLFRSPLYFEFYLNMKRLKIIRNKVQSKVNSHATGYLSFWYTSWLFSTLFYRSKKFILNVLSSEPALTWHRYQNGAKVCCFVVSSCIEWRLLKSWKLQFLVEKRVILFLLNRCHSMHVPTQKQLAAVAPPPPIFKGVIDNYSGGLNTKHNSEPIQNLNVLKIIIGIIQF